MNMKVEPASEPPHHFIQIISDQILHLGKLQIPTQFVPEYDELKLCSFDVLLEVPTGDTWSIRLEKPDHSSSVVLLGHGLQNFMKHYSLGVGSLVMFRSEERRPSVFSVIIFDISLTEISYPPRSDSSIDTSADDEQIIILDSDTTSDEEDGDEDAFFEHSGVCGTSANPIEIDSDADEHLQILPFTPKANLQKKKTRFPRSNRTPAAKPKQRRLSFCLRILPSYLKRKSRVTIPHKFIEANNLKDDAPWNVWIQPDGSRKTWWMRILYRKNERRGEFSNAGWHTFHREFGLCEGDRCKFKLTEKTENALFFTVFVTYRSSNGDTLFLN